MHDKGAYDKPVRAVADALWEHIWKGSDAPPDECDCCALVAFHAIKEAGYVVVPADWAREASANPNAR